MKNLWFLPPILYLWPAFYIAYQLVEKQPFESWWTFPFLISLVLGWVFLSIACGNKYNGG